MSTARRITAWVAAVVVGAATMLGLAAPAFADNGDVVNSMNLTYTVQPDGSAQVVQDIDYSFGSSGRHGIFVYVPVREQYQDSSKQDRVYQISAITASSPTPGVNTNVSTQVKSAGSNSRNEYEYIQIGSSNATVPTRQATYHLTYTVSRTIMTGSHGDEFYWDAVPVNWGTITTATVTVNTPTAAVDTSCYVGTVGSSTSCPATGNGTKTQTYTATNLGNGRGLTVSSTFEAGAVNPNTPELAPTKASETTKFLGLSGIASAVTALLAVLGGVWFSRTRRDERFVGVPPGLLPASGQNDTVGRDDKPEIPVQFNPPPISVGEAGMLDDGTVDVRDTTATMVSLAVQGYIKLGQPDKNTTIAQLLRTDAPQLPHEVALLRGIFGPAPQPGMTVDLSAAHSLTATHEAVSRDIRQELQRRGLYKHLPSALGGPSGSGLVRGLGGLVALAMFTGTTGAVTSILTSNALFFLLPLVPVVALLIFMWMRVRRGQRSATGRAVQDQIEGFRKYIATAEASQLKIEEGEDIFSKYLPWAIMFGLADRWTKLCAELVRMGRIPDYQPSWYFGPWYGYGMFNPIGFGSALDQSFTPAPSTSGSGSGFSGFGGGGSVGGGGGGGGGGSW